MELKLHCFGREDAKYRGLWLHGWLGTGQEGEALQQELGEDVRLLCPDLPGHGETPLEGWILSKTLEQIEEFAANCDWVGGYSMGGRLLMMSAARYPEAFGKMVIESASLGYPDAEARTDRKRLDRERAENLRTQGLKSFCAGWYQMEMWGGFSNFPERAGDANALAGALELFSVANQPDLRQWLLSTFARVLWLAGSRDGKYAEQASWVKQHTHHSVLLLDAGHNMHAQQPREWAKAVGSLMRISESSAEQ